MINFKVKALIPLIFLILLVSCFIDNKNKKGVDSSKASSNDESENSLKNLEINPSLYKVTYSDDFDGAINSEWRFLEGSSFWGREYFSSNSKYFTYGEILNKQYLELKAYVENQADSLRNFSSGIYIPTKVWDGNANIKNSENPFYYGYYEIESRITKGSQSMDEIGLWPAFWFQHSEENDPEEGKFWYEEIDIFEPGACQVKDDYTAFHYWTLESNDEPYSSDNTWKDPEHEYFFHNVDMFNWHRWGVEWLPDRITFYYDRKPIHTITKRIPLREGPQLFIDLQTDPYACMNPKDSANQFIGSFQIDYFRYWRYDAEKGAYDPL